MANKILRGKEYKIHRGKDGRPEIRIPKKDLPPDLLEQLERSFANNGGDEVDIPAEATNGSLSLDLRAFLTKGAQ